MATGPHDRLRGATPRPPREVDEDAGTYQWLSPAARSAVREIFVEALTERSASAESMIAARVKVDTRAKLLGYRIGVGGLGALLIGALSWAGSAVQAYGDGREEAARAAIAAESKAQEAADRAEATEAMAARNDERLDQLEPKVDEALVLLREVRAELERDGSPGPAVARRRPR